MPANASFGRDAAVAATARALSALYWDLADELRQAAVTLSTTLDAGDELPVVSMFRLADAMKAGMVLRYLADRGRQ